jgi:hypothetical protein
VPLENVEGAALRVGVGRPHPEQQAAAVQLLLQVLGVALVQPVGKDRADQRSRDRGSGSRHARWRAG